MRIRRLTTFCAMVLLVLCLSPMASAQNKSRSGLPPIGSEGDCLLTSSGAWVAGACPGAGTGAPTAATYLTQTANGTLSAEQAMGALGTGLVFNTTSTGVQSIYAGTTCTNQVIRILSVAGAATCATITASFVDTTIWTGTVASGILKASLQGTLAQATAGTDYTSPTSTESPTNKTFNCNGAGNSCLNIDLTADVIGILPSATGGTANGFTKFSGPASTEKTFTLPNASASILTTNASVTLAQGGTNQNIWTPADCVRVNAGGTALESAGAACGGSSAPTDATYWTGAANGTLSAEINLGALGTGLVINTAGTPSIFAGTACTNMFARSLNASGVATCAAVSLTADITGTLGVANGGTGLTTFSINQVLVGTATAVFTAKTLPSCSNATTSKLLYDNGTQAFSCGTDQAGGGGGAATSVTPTTVTVTSAASPYTVLTTDRQIRCSTAGGAVVLTLPAATNALELAIAHFGANTCTLNTTGTDTFTDSGATSTVMSNPVYESFFVSSSQGTAWQIY